MLAQIHKAKGGISLLLLVAGAMIFVSCESQQHINEASRDVGLVHDPDAQKGDSMIPWNKQEKWETSSQLGGVTDRR